MTIFYNMNRLLKILIFLYFFSFPFGQLARVDIGNNITILASDVLVGLFSFIFLISILKKKIKLPVFSKYLFYFLAIAFFSLVFNAPQVTIIQFLVGASYLVRLGSYIVFYIGLWNLIQEKIYSKGELVKNLITIGVFVGVFGLIQYLILPDLRFLRAEGWDDHYFRLSGTYLDPAFTGIILVLFSLLSFTKGIFEKRLLYYVLGFFGVVCISLTYSRASYLSLTLGLIVLYYFKGIWKIILLSVCIFVITLQIAPKPGGEGVNLQRTSTVVSRYQNYIEAFNVFKSNPVFGVGYNLYRFQRLDNSINLEHSGAGSDSSILFILATTGIAGMAVFIGLLVKLGYWSFRSIRQYEGLALSSSLIALSVHSLFSNSLFYPWVLGWTLILLVTVKESR